MESLGRDLVLLAKAIRARLESRLANAGASLPAWGVLSCAIEEQGLSQRQLAERMGIEGATLTRHLDRLEADGLITRQRDGDDRRILPRRADPGGPRSPLPHGRSGGQSRRRPHSRPDRRGTV